MRGTNSTLNFVLVRKLSLTLPLKTKALRGTTAQLAYCGDVVVTSEVAWTKGGSVDLRSALGELADMLSVAADAAQTLVKQEQELSGCDKTLSLLSEVSKIADRLREIGYQIRTD